jgi:hypothetical protein
VSDGLGTIDGGLGLETSYAASSRFLSMSKPSFIQYTNLHMPFGKKYNPTLPIKVKNKIIENPTPSREWRKCAKLKQPNINVHRPLNATEQAKTILLTPSD